jgi:hypothetical protein
MLSEYGVLRWSELPTGDLKGRFVVAESVLEATRNALVGFALIGIEDGGHEGLVFWAGREFNGVTVFTTVIIPDCEHSAGRVFVPRHAAAGPTRAARSCQLGLLCQVHSHPGTDARHSSGDDEMIFMPFEGMLSIVVPNYGIGFKLIRDACVHQFQSNRWVLCSESSISNNLTIAPATIDLR